MSKTKPLGMKAYGSIPHLPGSRKGPGDHTIHEGQARICTERVRDRHDRIIVQHKWDGSCVAVARIGENIVPLGRAGWPAITSPYEMHRLFHDWAWEHQDAFRALLDDGERACGEWLAQAHGIIYDLVRVNSGQPFVLFDIMRGTERVCYNELATRNLSRAGGFFETPSLLHEGNGPYSIEQAQTKLDEWQRHFHYENEGAVWRVERKGKVDFLAKWVRPDKVDGKYLPELNGGQEVWLWRPCAKPAERSRPSYDAQENSQEKDDG